MHQKVLKIPILPHLKKYVEQEYRLSRSGIVVIDQRIIPPRSRVKTTDYRRYFKQPSNRRVFMTVKTKDSRLYKLYAWIQHIDHDFSKKMIDYTAVRMDIQEASVSIRNFLALYGITESDYAFYTAYKKWQRSKAYKNLKEQKELEKCLV